MGEGRFPPGEKGGGGLCLVWEGGLIWEVDCALYGRWTVPYMGGGLCLV